MYSFKKPITTGEEWEHVTIRSQLIRTGEPALALVPLSFMLLHVSAITLLPLAFLPHTAAVSKLQNLKVKGMKSTWNELTLIKYFILLLGLAT